ncbi:triose-phosphate transporter family-domain-containing protein [Xylariomycetidae sp. FL0641]|nr:triose-phosphate transporter family-domain-containing protein [Xylariomycetidae sp. FL0641]
MPPPPLSNQQPPQHHRQSTLTPLPHHLHGSQGSHHSHHNSHHPHTLAVTSVLSPNLANRPNTDFSTPSSASSATTSFKIDWPSDASAAAASSSLSSAKSQANRRPDDIEMDAIAPAGHRRRRSTLTASVNNLAQNNPRSPRPRSLSVKSPGAPEPKISEESSPTTGVSRAESRADDSFSDEDLHDDEETGLTKKDRRRKRDKRRRNTRLDQRIVRDKLTDEERKEADQNVIRKMGVNALLIGLWYLFSLSISLYNKWMFDSGQLNFPFPLFTTSMHMLVQFILASLVLYFIPSFRPNNAHHTSDQGRSRHEVEPDRPLMTKLFYLTRIGPCGAATGLDIGLGNTSLKFITLTFYTMCKSSALAFVLIFAFVFRLETPTWRLVAIIGTMTAGVVMMVAGEVEFKLGGFMLVISAAFFSGFRWGLTQILLLRHPATSNPFSSIFFLAPVMFFTLVLIALPVEGPVQLGEALQNLAHEWGPFQTPILLLFPGTIAFLMTACEFALLQRSSVVTLSIAGIFKEVVTISAAALVFDDTLTPINISGLLVTISAIGAYNWIKLSQMRTEAQQDAHSKLHQGAQSCSSSDHGSDMDEEETGLLAHEDTSGVEDNLVTVDGDLIPKVHTPKGFTDENWQNRAEHSRED